MSQPSQPSPPSSKPPSASGPSSQPAVVASTGEVRRLARAMEQIANHCGRFFVEVSAAIQRDHRRVVALLLAALLALAVGDVLALAELRAVRGELQRVRERCGR